MALCASLAMWSCNGEKSETNQTADQVSATTENVEAADTATMAAPAEVAPAEAAPETVEAEEVEEAVNLQPSDFFKMSGKKVLKLKDRKAIKNTLDGMGFKLIKKDVTPGDPDADLAWEQDGWTIYTYSKDNVKISFDDTPLYVEIDFDDASQASDFASAVNKAIKNTSDKYFNEYYAEKKGKKVRFGYAVN